MRLSLVSFAALLTFPSIAVAQSQTSVYGSARSWNISAHTENGVFQGCSGENGASNNWIRLQNHTHLGWAVQVEAAGLQGLPYGYVEIDRASHEAQFDGDGAEVYFSATDPIIEGIRVGSSMSLSVPGQWQSPQFSLSGTAAAISAIHECVRNQGQAPASGSRQRSATASSGGGASGGSSCPSFASYPSQDMGGGAEAYFLNNTGRALIVYWVDWNGGLQEMGALPAQDGYVQQTTVGHNFVARDRDGRCYGGILAVDGPSIRFTVQ